MRSHESKKAAGQNPSPLYSKVEEFISSQYRDNAPQPTMRTKLERTGDIKQVCDQRIQKAHNEKGGKLTVGGKGVIRDDNGHKVRAFAFECGRFNVEGTLYRGVVVDMPDSKEVHLLLIRSDITSPMYTLFPDIGTAKDWRTLQKCAERFSPKWASRRHEINMRESRHAAAEAAAAKHLEQSGAVQKGNLDVFQGMSTAKLHMMDLCSIIALICTFIVNLIPQMIHVIVTRDEDDMDEVRRIFKALDFSIGEHAPGLDIPSITVRGMNTLDIWRKASRFSFIRYEDTRNVDCLFDSMSQVQALDGAQYPELFPYPPVVVGPHIWSNRNCVEIDMRGVRFSDEELRTARKYVATLLKNHDLLMDKLSGCWAGGVATQDAALTPYPNLWFQAFHVAVGETIFPASYARIDYMVLTREADAARLRIRENRQQRYDKAIREIMSATRESPWVYSSKPSTLAEALDLLGEEYDAFLHQKDGRPVLAFTEDSLIRRARLERQEVDDFVMKLKAKHLLENKTHPVTFKNQEQKRFICINAEALTVTGDQSDGGAG